MRDITLIRKVGKEVFEIERKTFQYEDLMTKVLGPNTYRGFHKIDKSKPGSKEIFEKLFFKHKDFITSTLCKIKNEKSLNDFENELCKELKMSLKKNITNSQLNSFNKLRKPIDIAIEHFVIMSKDFIKTKSNLAPFLFLPLDSQMFKSQVVFSDNEIKDLKIKRSFSFKDIYEEQHYHDVQTFLKEKATLLKIHRIYFDLVWGYRFTKKSAEIFKI